MTLLRFIDVAATLLYEEFQRVGQDVFEAFESTRRWAEGTLATLDAVVDDDGVARLEQAPTVEHVPTPAENDRSMAQFMGQLAGVQGAPG